MSNDPTKLPVGVVINSYGDVTAKNYPWWKKWVLTVAYAAIRAYQKDKHPNSPRIEAVHSMLHLGEGFVLDVNFPKATIHKLEYLPGAKYTYWLWAGATQITDDALWQMRLAAERLNGTGYDWLQLGGIKIQVIFARLLKAILPPPYGEKLGELISLRTLLGLGRTRMVCSGGAHSGLLAAYKEMKRAGIAVPRPLGDQWVEITCPADFENHESFIEWTPAV